MTKRSETINGLQALRVRADLNEDEVATVEAAIAELKKGGRPVTSTNEFATLAADVIELGLDKELVLRLMPKEPGFPTFADKKERDGKLRSVRARTDAILRERRKP